jgi:hypothetical protein
MPRKRVPFAERETAASRALRAAVEEATEAMLARMPEPTPESRAANAKHGKKFQRQIEKNGPEAAIEWLATRKPLPDDDDEDVYAAHQANAVRPLLAKVATPAPEVVEPYMPRPAKQVRVSHVHPELYDFDDWED